MRLPAALLVAALLLAGCSGSGGKAPAGATPASSSSTTSTGPPPPPRPTSDTLHLLEMPRMAPALPSGGAEVATPVGFANGGGAGAAQSRWNYVVRHGTNITGGEAHIWVNVKETLIVTTNPAQPQCTWQLTVLVGADNAPLNPCINEQAGTVQPGIKELVFPLTVDSPIQTEQNESISLGLARSGFSLSTNNAVDLLSGSSDHDSRLQLKGLAEEIPA